MYIITTCIIPTYSNMTCISCSEYINDISD